MRLEFIGVNEDKRSFCNWGKGYDFYIVYEDDEESMLTVFEKEFELNCREQLLKNE